MHLIRKTINIIPKSKGILQNSLTHFFSDKYPKSSFEWQPSEKKPQKSHDYRNQNTQQKDNPNQNTQQKNNPHNQNTYHKNPSNENQRFFQKRKDSNSTKNDIKEQQSSSFEENHFQLNRKQFGLNKNLSLLSQIMGLKKVDQVCAFYDKHHQLYSPRILVISMRQFISLLEKQKNNPYISSQRSVLMIQKHLAQIFASILPKLRTEEIQKQEVKNLLFFIKKILIDYISLIHMLPGTLHFNKQLHQKSVKFRDQLLTLFLEKSFDYSHYEIHELVEIHYELIKFSQALEMEGIYKCIAERQILIQATVNPQLLFSATNFMTNVKHIESSIQYKKYQNDKQQDNQKSPLVIKYRDSKTKEDQTRIVKLREKCYEIFFKKWAYYIDDMNEFIKLADIQKIWPTIIIYTFGNKMLLRDKNGVSVMRSICKILEANGSKVQELINNHPRVLSNSLGIFWVLERKHKSEGLMKDLVQKGRNLVKQLPLIEKNKFRVRMKTYATFLRQQKMIDKEEEADLIYFINTL